MRARKTIKDGKTGRKKRGAILIAKLKIRGKLVRNRKLGAEYRITDSTDNQREFSA